MTSRLSLAALLLSMAAMPAFAGTQLITNGNFALSSDSTSSSCQLSYNCTADGWSSPNGYNFIFLPGTATSSGAQGVDGLLSLWGASNGGSSSWDGNAPAAVMGSNFLAADGAYEVEPITQTVTGLTAGTNYALTFDWAGAQQSGFTSATTEQWVVSLGSQTHDTAVVSNNPKGFTGWTSEYFTFTATSTSEVLSFLAVGTPGGEPPFSVLADVSLEAVPEPGSLVMVGAGVLGLLALRRKRTA